jgi:sugar phosphate isomerase/epimerase
MTLAMFSKHFAPLSVAEMAPRIAGLGFDGVDLTVRPGGHVAPEAVASELPAAVATLREHGLRVPMITTGIVTADATAAAIFAAAATEGIRWLKLGYWPYRPFGSLRAQLDGARQELEALARLAASSGICACIHTHSGNYLSATAAGMQILLEGQDPSCVGAYLDPGHLTVEGGASGWQQAIDLLQQCVRLIAVKDFGWVQADAGADGKARWRAQMVPLRDGIVPWPEVFSCLRRIGFDGVVSVHSEYQGSHSWRDLTLDELVDQTRDDLDYLRGVLHATGYVSASP